MNKQEAIKKLESIKTIGNDAKAACYNEGINAGITIIKQLDEPQKPVVPKFFDVWAKRVIAKHDEFYAISLVARAGWGYGVDFELSENGSSSENKDLLYWIIDKCSDNYPNKKKAIEALLYGYEVEKEPLYKVIMPNPQSKNGNVLVLRRTQQGTITVNKVKKITARLGEGMDLTEEEIKSVDERYWPFAVPVEEVVEG